MQWFSLCAEFLICNEDQIHQIVSAKEEDRIETRYSVRYIIMLMRGQRSDLSDVPSPEPERPTRAWGWLASLGLGIVAAVMGQIPALAALFLFHERGLGPE